MAEPYLQHILQYAVYDILQTCACVVIFTEAYAQDVIKKISISAWNSSILSKQFLRKLSIILVTWTSAIY